MLRPFVVWYDREGPIEVSTVQEMDSLLDWIAASPRYRKFPVIVSISRSDEQQIVDVLVGRDDLSLLIWYLAKEDIAASKGTIPTSEEIMFNYGGTATDAYIDTAITVEAARQAVREFVATGQRPSCVEWQVPDLGAG
jgi:predicted AAA+ superfamily ATPase